MHNLLQKVNYINWRLVNDKKVPWSVKADKPIAPNDPTNWMSYEDAKSLSDRVGIALDGSFAVIDLDDYGANKDAHDAILSVYRGRTFIERSVSGDGFHIYLMGTPPVETGNRKGKVELYYKDRFIALGTAENDLPVAPLPVPPLELLTRSDLSDKGRSLLDLYTHGHSDGDDCSSVDLAFVNSLASMYSRDDALKIWKSSALWRDKCDEREDYVGRTLDKAFGVPTVGGDKPKRGNRDSVVQQHLSSLDLRFDTFKQRMIYNGQNYEDDDLSRIKALLETKHNLEASADTIRRCLPVVAKERKFDSLIEAIPQWDGVPRVRTFCTDHLGLMDSPYHEGVALYIWTALAGRALQPAVKADMVPIFISAQGLAKSTFVESMALFPESFRRLSLAEKDDDLKRKMRGASIVELDELRGLKTRELESLKAFITNTTDDLVEKYQTQNVQLPRRCLFIGTTNDDELFTDRENRRFLPVEITKRLVPLDEHTRNQLWAEGAALFKQSGVAYIVPNQAEVVKRFMVENALQGRVEKFLSKRKQPVTVAEIAEDLFPIGNPSPRDLKLIGEALVALGYSQTRKNNRRSWCKQEAVNA